ncbi:hypothetical protein DFH11DRAFT_1881018 [Phellopilus nigrolimitatus]|nr:hypothetical protein DFH11DRAFT_1881018 [Phellopilus nigrolimitatus]
MAASTTRAAAAQCVPSRRDVQSAARTYLPGRARRYPACGRDSRRRRRRAARPTSPARPVQATEPPSAASDTRTSIDHASTTATRALSLQDDTSSTASSDAASQKIWSHPRIPFLSLVSYPMSAAKPAVSDTSGAVSAAARTPLPSSERAVPVPQAVTLSVHLKRLPQDLSLGNGHEG